MVSKPAQNYDDRLIPAELLGEFTRGTDEPPKEDEPSPKEDEETDDDGNTTDPPVNTAYLPIGRRGLYDEEEAFYSGRTWTWFEFSETWMLTNSDGDPKGGGII